MSFIGGVGAGAAYVGVATGILGGTGLALGLTSGALSNINRPSDGRKDALEPLKLVGAGLATMAVAGTAAAFLGRHTNNPAATAAAGVAMLGGLATFAGALGVGIQFAD